MGYLKICPAHSEFKLLILRKERFAHSKSRIRFDDAVIEWSGNKVQPISYILINPDGSVYVPKAF